MISYRNLCFHVWLHGRGVGVGGWGGVPRKVLSENIIYYVRGIGKKMALARAAATVILCSLVI